MEDTIIIVSGLPRSGTSMMMAMLGAGGIPLMTDTVRRADSDNPHGYFEYEPVKRLRTDASWIPMARGKALKVVSPLLTALPSNCRYAVLFMERNLEEVLTSQRAMLEKSAAARLTAEGLDDGPSPRREDRLKAAYIKHLREVRQWLSTCHNMHVLDVSFTAVLENPGNAVRRIARFLAVPLDEPAMALAVDAGLRRQGRFGVPVQPNTSDWNSRPQ